MVNGHFQAPPPPGTRAGCAFCHLGAETTSASVRNLAGHGMELGDVIFKNAGFDLRMERMFMSVPPVPAGTTSIVYDPATYTVLANGQPVRVSVYDSGWYNIGVRPTAEDPGVDGTDPFGNSLAWTKLFQASANPGLVAVPGGGLGCSSLIRPLGMTAQQMQDLVAFLVALTDERVRWQKAPFDHPQLFVPNGDVPIGTDAMAEVPAVGATGAVAPLDRFLGLNPFVR